MVKAKASADRVIRYTKSFKKDLSRAGSHKKCDLVELKNVIENLANAAIWRSLFDD